MEEDRIAKCRSVGSRHRSCAINLKCGSHEEGRLAEAGQEESLPGAEPS